MPNTRFLLRLLVVLAALGAIRPATVLAADSWLMPGHDAGNTYFNSGAAGISAARIARMHTAWTASLHVSSALIATDRAVYALVPGAEGRGAVAVVDAHTGRLVHTFASLHLAAGDTLTALAYAHGRLIVAEALHAIVALDPKTGRTDWVAPLGADTLTVAGTTILTGNLCSSHKAACRAASSAAIDVRSGKVLWRHDGAGGGRPVMAAGLLYQPWTVNGRSSTRVYNPSTGALLATLSLAGTWTGDAHDAYFTARTGATTTLGKIASTGKPAWKLSLGSLSARSAAPALAYGMLFAPSNRFHAGLVAVDVRSGRTRWAVDLGSISELEVANGLLFAVNASRVAIDVLNARTGAILWHMPLPAGGSPPVRTITGIVVAGGALYRADGASLAAILP